MDPKIRKTIFFLVKWLFIFLVSSVISFGIGRLMPGSPAELLLKAYDLPETPENIALIEHKWGLDRPLFLQYAAWIWNFVRGDWGRSMISGLDIRGQFLRKLPYSLILGAGSIAISSVAAFWLGFFAAIRTRGFADRLSRALAVLSQTVPSMVMAVIIIYFFGVKHKMVKFFTGGKAAGIITATLLLSVYSIGSMSRLVRSLFREQMKKTYVKFAVTRGMERNRALLKLGSRGVFYGMLSVLISRFAWVLGGSSVMEFIFTIPGISYFVVDSLRSRDYYVIQSYILVIVIWMFFVHLIFQGLMEWLDLKEDT